MRIHFGNGKAAESTLAIQKDANLLSDNIPAGCDASTNAKHYSARAWIMAPAQRHQSGLQHRHDSVTRTRLSLGHMMSNAEISNRTSTIRPSLSDTSPVKIQSEHQPEHQSVTTLNPVLLNKSAQRFLGACGSTIILTIVLSAFSNRAGEGGTLNENFGPKFTQSSTLAGSFQIDVNAATPIELMLLPKIGKKTADAIVLDRRSNGRFGSVDQLTRVPGIGIKTLQEIAPFCTIHGGNGSNKKPPMIVRKTSSSVPQGRLTGRDS